MFATRLVPAGLGAWMLIALSQGAAPTGVITGSAGQETRPPYADYLVRVRDAEFGQPGGSGVVGEYASFSVDHVTLERPILLELVNVKDGRIVCVQGPYRLSPDTPIRTDVTIECGKKPAARWLLPAGAGLAAATTYAVHSVSR